MIHPAWGVAHGKTSVLDHVSTMNPDEVVMVIGFGWSEDILLDR
jgi:hypothetical protein